MSNPPTMPYTIVFISDNPDKPYILRNKLLLNMTIDDTLRNDMFKTTFTYDWDHGNASTHLLSLYGYHDLTRLLDIYTRLELFGLAHFDVEELINNPVTTPDYSVMGNQLTDKFLFPELQYINMLKESLYYRTSDLHHCSNCIGETEICDDIYVIICDDTVDNICDCQDENCCNILSCESHWFLSAVEQCARCDLFTCNLTHLNICATCAIHCDTCEKLLDVDELDFCTKHLQYGCTSCCRAKVCKDCVFDIDDIMTLRIGPDVIDIIMIRQCHIRCIALFVLDNDKIPQVIQHIHDTFHNNEPNLLYLYTFKEYINRWDYIQFDVLYNDVENVLAQWLSFDDKPTDQYLGYKRN